MLNLTTFESCISIKLTNILEASKTLKHNRKVFNESGEKESRFNNYQIRGGSKLQTYARIKTEPNHLKNLLNYVNLTKIKYIIGK